jgi:hypothetical protein
MGSTTEQDASSALIPNKKKEAEERPRQERSLDQQQQGASAPPPASLTADHKKNQTSRASELLAGVPLSEPSALFKEEEKKDPLSSPLKQEKEPSVLTSATSDDSGSQAQRFPKAQAALEHPTTMAALTAAPLALRASSPAASDTTTDVPIDHPVASTATSASILWERAPVAVGLARNLPPYAQPSSSIVAAVDNAVHQELVSDLAYSHESSSAGRQIPSEGTPAAPQPSLPVPFGPWHEDSFSLSGGGSMSSSGGGIGPLLVLGVLALGGWLLLRPDSRTYLASSEPPKLSSALLTPLERPG